MDVDSGLVGSFLCGIRGREEGEGHEGDDSMGRGRLADCWQQTIHIASLRELPRASSYHHRESRLL